MNKMAGNKNISANNALKTDTIDKIEKLIENALKKKCPLIDYYRTRHNTKRNRESIKK